MHIFDQSDLHTKLYGNISTKEFVVLQPQASRMKQFWVWRYSHEDVFHNMLLV